MPLFVLLRHETGEANPRASHWDLMLDDTEKTAPADDNQRRLWTWALEESPIDVDKLAAPSTAARQNTDPIICRRLPDHRALYLRFEGALSGNRGVVTRIDAGHYQLLESLRGASGELTRLTARFEGRTLRGTALIELKDRANSTEWEFRWIESQPTPRPH